MKSTDKTSWLTVNGEDANALALKLQSEVEAKISSGKYTARDVSYLKTLNRPVLSEKLNVSEERLEKLRALCQAWDIEIRASSISSHRPIIGPLIVLVKKTLQPLLKILLRDTINQQRNFNAAVITAVVDLTNEIEKVKTHTKS